MKFWVTLEGREAEVEFQTDGEHVRLEVEGKAIDADFRRLPDGEVYSLLIGGRSHEVRIAPAAGALEVTVDGATLAVEVRDPLEKLLAATARTTGVGGGETVAAPMPGLVVALRVKPGDRVAAGEAVAVIEAMKMQNELIARHGGVVQEVLVAERATVAAGTPLVRIAAEPE